jgi:hypothetical protein
MATVGFSARPLLEDKASEKQTPKSLYDVCMSLEVPLDGGGTVRVKISKYLNASSTPGKDSNGGPGLIALKQKLPKVAKYSGGAWNLPVGTDDPARRMSIMGPDLRVTSWEMWRFFVGKASPQEIRRTLFMAQAAGVVPPNQIALQQYCDAQAGMDCSGFASVDYGYQRINNEGYSATAYRARGIERKTLEEFRPGDAIVWLQDDHIALIDQIDGPNQTSPEMFCMVGESTAGTVTPSGPGVQYSRYAFERDTTNASRKYKMYRPKAAGGYTEMSPAKFTVRGNP